MPRGLPARTRNTIVDVYGQLRSGRRRCQSAATAPARASASMSGASARVTTSASRPSITARACLPEPPCDCAIVTVSPVVAFQSATNAASNSWYSSRVGS